MNCILNSQTSNRRFHFLRTVRRQTFPHQFKRAKNTASPKGGKCFKKRRGPFFVREMPYVEESWCSRCVSDREIWIVRVLKSIWHNLYSINPERSGVAFSKFSHHNCAVSSPVQKGNDRSQKKRMMLYGFGDATGMKMKNDFFADEQNPRQQTNVAHQRDKLGPAGRIKKSIDLSHRANPGQSPKHGKHFKDLVQTGAPRALNIFCKKKWEMNNLKTTITPQLI